MTYRAARLPIIAALALLAGCANRPEAVAVASPPPPAPALAAPMPAGAHDGMAIPARAADGRYATPNRDLSPAATVWHLRAALNVAALACRGMDEAAIVTGYNRLLANRRDALATAERDYAAEYRAAGGADWRARYDDAQTRLYNFFSQSFARDGFCRAAAATLDDADYIDAAALPGFAAGRLAAIEQPFTDFYAAYDAWRAPPIAMAPAIVIASAAPVAPGPRVMPARTPLDLDPSVFADNTVTH